MASTGGVKIGGTYDEARTRKMNAEAEVAELTLQQIHGELVVASDVVSAWEDVLAALKSKITSIPVKAAPVVAAESNTNSCKLVLEDLVNEALEELSNYDPKVKAGEAKKSASSPKGSNAGAKTASGVKRKRVGGQSKTARLQK
tara:strand:+ start:197 stop:628 length:432 start_codon:yes stop_codon:yes gene_type:complete